MDWQRFHYLFRRYADLKQDGKDFSNQADIIQSDANANLYGGATYYPSVPREIVRKLKVAKPEVVLKASNIYSGLNYSEVLSVSPKYKRTGEYVLFMSIFFILISAIYHLYVFPTFISMFDAVDLEVSKQLAFFANYGYAFFIALFLVNIFSVFFALQVKRILAFHVPWERSIFMRVFLPDQIYTHYLMLLEMIVYPVRSELKGYKQGQVSEYVERIENEGADITTELSIMVKVQGEKLNKLLNIYSSRLLMFTAVFVVAVIISFVMGVYLSLFTMGEIA